MIVICDGCNHSVGWCVSFGCKNDEGEEKND